MWRNGGCNGRRRSEGFHSGVGPGIYRLSLLLKSDAPYWTKDPGLLWDHASDKNDVAGGGSMEISLPRIEVGIKVW